MVRAATSSPFAGADLSQRLVPDGLWELAAPLLPPFFPRPQGGGTAPWRRLHRAVSDELGAQGELDWSSAITDAASVRNEKGGTLTGPSPVDRGKKGSKLHVLSEAQGIPLAVAVSAANTHDSLALKPLVRGIPAVRSRRGPRRRRPGKLRADKAHLSADHLTWLRERGLIPRIARPGIESRERLGRHRWKTERSIAWLFGYRRLTVRYERTGSHFHAFLGLAAALTCYKKRSRLRSGGGRPQRPPAAQR
ncbi:IS5 family transposase [Streptomyces erythrochromogenes]|uniref:IS5 family transposase n=1 Tax=Streptomyces erythrochromogenes TaxID=285574 RepID=UPI003F60CC1F